MRSDFSEALLTWYAKKARSLPWRDHPEPYTVWVSEVMLQQTRVETVIPYFERWMASFPSIPSLAAASQGEVLSAWEGLGYYRRARNLHLAAQIVLEEFDGILPAEPKHLRRLPGIGPYTAAAVASIAYGRDEPAVDANVRRVFARVFDISHPAHSPQSEKRIAKLADLYLPPGKAGEYNQALMDLGSAFCTPRNPACPHCPLRDLCRAYASGIQEQRPVILPKTRLPHHTVAAGIILRREQVLLTRRPQNGLLGGLWEFPGGKLQPGESLSGCLQRELHEELGVDVEVQEPFGVYRTAYTHFKVTLHAFYCCLPNGEEPQLIQVDDMRWVAPAALSSFPMGKIDRQIAQNLQSVSSECT